MLVHDAHAEDPSTAFALSRLADITTLDHSPIGVFRDIKRAAYDRQVNDQLAAARAKARRRRPGDAARRPGHLVHRMTASRLGALD